MHGRPWLARRIDRENGLVVIRVWTFWMKESGDGSHENAGEKEDGGQPHWIPLNSPEGCSSDH
jgi:hypothetical protein